MVQHDGAKVGENACYATPLDSEVAELTFVRINDLAAPVERMNALMCPSRVLWKGDM